MHLQILRFTIFNLYLNKLLLKKIITVSFIIQCSTDNLKCKYFVTIEAESRQGYEKYKMIARSIMKGVLVLKSGFKHAP